MCLSLSSPHFTPNLLLPISPYSCPRRWRIAKLVLVEVLSHLSVFSIILKSNGALKTNSFRMIIGHVHGLISFQLLIIDLGHF